VIGRDALRTVERRASRSPHRETGGLLLGFRAGTDVHVADVIEVRDPSATRTRFTLSEKKREAALARYLDGLDRDSPLGYVGTWHSHPANAGPSWTDRQTFRIETVTAPDTVAMLVIARSRDGWVSYALLPSGRCRIRRVTTMIG
jgi:integrative and conjugative element protein (TIGR02256 family)